MKLTCPTCQARYSIDDARVTGKRVKIRCRSCADVFVATAPAPADSASEVEPQPHAQASARPGARHEESVLFSLQALRHAEESTASPPVVDGSGLIDIKKLAAVMATTSGPRSSSDSIAHLGTAGVFAPTLSHEPAPPGEAWATRAPRPARGRSAMAASACLAIALLATTRLWVVAERESLPSHSASATAAAPGPPPLPAPVTSAPETPKAPEVRTAPEPAPSAVAITPPAITARKPVAPRALPPFDAAATTRALGGVDLRTCTLVGGPPFEGHARVTLDPSGAVSGAVVDSPELAGTPAARCVAAAFGRVKVPAFAGSALTVGKRFVVMGS